MPTARLLDASANVERYKAGNRILIFRSSAMERVVSLVEQARSSMRPVLITGETGTGKELIARMLHSAGATATQPFIAVNCAAFPPALIEDEIFGHTRGAFTDARSDRPGKIAAAGKGILFFDEIGEMPLELQAKLLRLLQENAYSMVGADSEMEAECRFIFATNRDITEIVARNMFRLDLYYRISVFEINIPPLRSRKEDIAPLVRYYLLRFCAELGREPVEIDEVALQALLEYAWPGNIRELENFLYRLLSGLRGNHIAKGNLPEYIKKSAPADIGSAVAPVPEDALNKNFDELVDRYASSLIAQALKKAGGNKTRAAELLGIKRTRLLYRIKELGL